jgi:hypothetical protein
MYLTLNHIFNNEIKIYFMYILHYIYLVLHGWLIGKAARISTKARQRGAPASCPMMSLERNFFASFSNRTFAIPYLCGDGNGRAVTMFGIHSTLVFLFFSDS